MEKTENDQVTALDLTEVPHEFGKERVATTCRSCDCQVNTFLVSKAGHPKPIWHKGAYNRTFPCMEATYSYAIKNQQGAMRWHSITLNK